MVEDNKLIAEFMECIKYKEEYVIPEHKCQYLGDKFDVADLEYSKSWDWLMPVVEKCKLEIEKYDYCSEEREFIEDEIFNVDNTMYELMSNDIDSIYARVVLFIKWYNKQ